MFDGDVIRGLLGTFYEIQNPWTVGYGLDIWMVNVPGKARYGSLVSRIFLLLFLLFISLWLLEH